MDRAFAILWVLASSWLLAEPGRAVDLTIPPADQNRILWDALSDTHCPLVCPGDTIPRCPSPPCADSNSCCDSFQEIVWAINAQPETADFRFLNGDIGIDSHVIYRPWNAEKFYSIWNQLADPKSFGMGNHEADIGVDSTGNPAWIDPENHYAPANWWEPLFGCDSTTAIEDCRRWYSVHIGTPPRVALLVTNNNSDSDGDNLGYIHCGTPWDGLHTSGTPQREWFNAEIDSMPSTVEVVFVTGHRTYYGVENFFIRPNVVFSVAGENQRTSPTSFLRDVESIYDRCPNVKRVIMVNGDQHCFAQTHAIRENVRDDARGVVYVTLGISGGRNDRATPFPALTKIPPGLLVHAFDDRWGFARFEITTDRVRMTVREAYSDSLLHQTEWTFGSGALDAPAVEAGPDPEESLRAWPNPSSEGFQIAFRFPAQAQSATLDDLSIYDVRGRRVRKLYSGTWTNGEYRRRWDLTDEDGRRVAAGTYFVRARWGEETVVKILTVLR